MRKLPVNQSSMIERDKEDAEAAEQEQDGAMEREPVRLSAPQQMALTAMGEGQSIKEAALAAGVNRSTVHRWIKSDAAFVAAYNAWQQEVCESARARLIRGTNLAVDSILSSIMGDGKLAFQLIKELGILRAPATVARTDPKLVEQQLMIEQGEEQMRLDRRQMKYLLAKAGLAPEEQGRFLASQSRTFKSRDQKRLARSEGEDPFMRKLMQLVPDKPRGVARVAQEGDESQVDGKS